MSDGIFAEALTTMLDNQHILTNIMLGVVAIGLLNVIVLCIVGAYLSTCIGRIEQKIDGDTPDVEGE